ncbi:NRAMP family divalent metal transporter [Sulfobacillus harzensis]|uniref:NRAMP family divalent metal transporter n=1 Tax=Sulfobacillus harzensis TaxID=2729629 RepID=UPI003083FED9
MQNLKATVQKSRRRQAIWLLILAIGPGVLGLAADNDAGGMLSYVVTGASHHLTWFIAALVLMAPLTYVVQELALRVAFATQKPYGQVIRHRLGHPWSRVNGLVLHALNMVILVTEFLGMAMGENMIGIPWPVAVILAFAIVLAITSWSRYQSVERLLLWISLLNLIFIPAALLLHPSPGAWRMAFSGSFTPTIGFLMLSLAGNAMAPWMIYWQQNAVWAGQVRTLKAGRQDIMLGVVAQVVMATVVLLIGGLTPGSGAVFADPLRWLVAQDGRLVGDMFALGIFNAGFLAACTISLSSAWMVRESWAPGAHPRQEMPTRGGLFLLHLVTLGVAAAAAIFLWIPIGTLALWAQALGALWMPISLVTLGLIARDRRTMGPMAIRWRRQLGLAAIIALFIGLAVLGLTTA